MRIYRLIGILSVLLQEEQTTASRLAEMFEVSKRTIHRDIDDLCMAGIPIMTVQGSGGGIRIMDGYRMDRTVLSSKDMQMILAGLKSLESVSGSSYFTQLMEKMQIGSSGMIQGGQSILIDLSSWYKEALVPKIEIIQKAIENRHLIGFMYYGPSHECMRSIEPYYLVFHWSHWYVWGWCTKRCDYRLFKLNRMEDICVKDEEYTVRNAPVPDLSSHKIFPKGEHVRILFSKEMKWRLIEEFGPHCFTQTEDGRLLFESDEMDRDNLVTWLMTFGGNAEVIEPEELKEQLCCEAEKIMHIYRKGNKHGV